MFTQSNASCSSLIQNSHWNFWKTMLKIDSTKSYCNSYDDLQRNYDCARNIDASTIHVENFNMNVDELFMIDKEYAFVANSNAFKFDNERTRTSDEFVNMSDTMFLSVKASFDKLSKKTIDAIFCFAWRWFLLTTLVLSSNRLLINRSLFISSMHTLLEFEVDMIEASIIQATSIDVSIQSSNIFMIDVDESMLLEIRWVSILLSLHSCWKSWRSRFTFDSISETRSFSVVDFTSKSDEKRKRERSTQRDQRTRWVSCASNIVS